MSNKRIDLDALDARYRAYDRAGGAGVSDVLRLLPATPEELRAEILRQIPEKAFQEQLREMAVSLGWLYYHTHDSRRSDEGFPDTVMVHSSGGPVIVAELRQRLGEKGGEPNAY